MTRTPIRWLLLWVFVLTSLGLTAVPASAHNVLRGSNPAADSTVAAAPGAVVLTFDDAAVSLGTRVEVLGPRGSAQTGEVIVVGTTVTQPLAPSAPAGRYTVRWRVTATDGHPVTGEFGFIAQGPGSAQPFVPAAAPTPPPASRAVWLWLALAGFFAVNAVVLVRRRSRRR